MKNISGIVPVILAAVVGIGAVVSLSDYTAPGLWFRVRR